MEPVYPVVVSLVAAAASIYAVVVSRKKVAAEADKAEAEAAAVSVSAAGDLVQSVMRQLTYMDGEVSKLQDTLRLVRARVLQLEQYIVAAGLPVL